MTNWLITQYPTRFAAAATGGGIHPTAKRYRCATYAMGSPVRMLDFDKSLELAAGLEDEGIV